MKSFSPFRLCLSLFAVLMSGTVTTAMAQDYYITGNNVNGHNWELSSPDCGFTEIGSGLYEWTGKVLGSGFNINDGTWTNSSYTYGSNGSALVLGTPYKYKQGEDREIKIDGNANVVNPKVTLDVISGTIVVVSLGDEPDDPEKPFANPDYALLTVNTKNGTGMTGKVSQHSEISIDFDIDQYWKISGAKLNGSPLDVPENSSSIDVKMNRDNTLDVTIEYRESLEWIDVLSAAATFEGTPITIAVEKLTISVSGLSQGDEVVLYNLSGQVVGSYKASLSHVSVAPGHGTYVVRVKDKAVKVTV